MMLLLRIVFVLSTVILAGEAAALSTEQHVIAVACSRNSSLPYCPPPSKAFGSKIFERERIRFDDGKETITENDKIACRELRDEYRKSCASGARRSADTKEFCEAFENVCFNIPESEPDQPTQSEKSAKNEPKQAKTVQNERKWMRKRSAANAINCAHTPRSRQTWAQNPTDPVSPQGLHGLLQRIQTALPVRVPRPIPLRPTRSRVLSPLLRALPHPSPREAGCPHPKTPPRKPDQTDLLAVPQLRY
ncbi:hypothetical protein L596_001822 [Steinernema carpocapsae]|uniref:Uncharacterized protein n=1 Tax=Steinernema carpocapsae TaxID=34508 RepID=A0A4V6I7I5_STECR|nr:hypothetical protein L596_001822 [Steinernema carpocapsae]